MKLLALDTATEACSVALWLDGELVERVELAGREHSARLPVMVDAVMAEAGISLRQLDGLVCGIGPGSFAGVRIGVSFIKGMALGLELPVAPVSSLAMLAQAALRDWPDATALAAIDARMGEVYFGCYRDERGVAHRVGVEAVSQPESVSIIGDGIDRWVGVGTGWAAHGEVLRQSVGTPPLQLDPSALPQAIDGLRCVAADFGRCAIDAIQLVPAYLRNNVALTKTEQAAARAATRRP